MIKKKRAGDKKQRLRFLISMLLIAAGVSLALFPFLANLYNRHILRAGEVEMSEPLKEEEGSPAIPSFDGLSENRRGATGEETGKHPAEGLQLADTKKVSPSERGLGKGCLLKWGAEGALSFGENTLSP